MKLLPKYTACLIFFSLSLLTFAFAFYGYPLFLGDSGCFLPVTYFIEHTHQLINPLYDAGIDPVTHKFLFYPPLFPYVDSLLMKIIPYNIYNFHITLTIIDNLSILVILLAIFCQAKKIEFENSFLNTLFIAIVVIVTFSFQGIAGARPEILSRLFIALFLINNITENRKGLNLINGLLIGLNAITSPISTIYMALIAACILAYKKQFTLKRTGEIFGGMFLVLVVFYFVYPFSVADLIHGMSKHSNNVIFKRGSTFYDFRFFITYHIANINTPLGVVPFVICACYTLWKLIARRSYLAIFFFSLLVLIVCYFSFKIMQIPYNLYVLSPVIPFLIFTMFAESYKLKGKPITGKMFRAAIILLLCTNSIGFIRRSVLFLKVSNKLVTANDYRKDFLNTLNQTDKNKKIVISFSLWPYSLDHTDKLALYRATDQLDSIVKDTSNQFLLMQQNNSGQLTPVEFPNYTLIKNEFVASKIDFLKIQLGNTYPGYQIAIYKRNKSR